MSFTLPDLPYAQNALAPHISEETIQYHYGKHHAGYVTKLNNGIDGSGFENKSLEEIITQAEPGGGFNNAAQIWNHTFYWHSMAPKQTEMHGKVADAIKSGFGSLDKFKEAFSQAATGHFGSGWAWLVKNKDGSVAVVASHDAGNPMRDGQTPLITCDVWEHAFYIDYRNDTGKYVESFWKLLNWDFAEENFGS
ncbi:MAG: superoxide dismutase [Gammaproteobacteria bacterium]